MGLLGTGWEDPQSAAIMALAGGLLQKNFGAGLLGANDAFSQAKANALRTQIEQAKLAEMNQKTAMEKAAIEAAQRKQAALPGLFSQGMSPGAFAPSADGSGPVMPQSEAPQGGQFDVMAAIRAGYGPDEIQKYAGLSNIGRQEVARTVNVPGPNGEKMVQQLDKFGVPVGKPMTEFEAAQFLNLGDRQVAAIPRAGMSLQMGQSPDSKASNALGWANNALTRRGQDMTDARAREAAGAGKVPAGYRIAADGNSLEFIPGGPADPNAAKRAAPTEFQGKAAMFGTRAQEADKILKSLDGQYYPSAVNTKEAMGRAPLIGGALEGVGNMALSDSGQKAEQAQRDFVNAVLRLESGAAISQSEFDNAKKQYFPQPFDSAAVKAQKAQNRALAIQGLLSNARPGAADAMAPKGGASGGWSIQKVN